MLTAGGFIDTNTGSSTYGEFSINVKKLNLFALDQGIRQKLADVKALVAASSSSNSQQCGQILERFYSACDPMKESCSNANQQTFQVTIDQVCDAVNSRTKLKFETIGDEFDNFADKIGNRKYAAMLSLL